jgi:hypothetical protein
VLVIDAFVEMLGTEHEHDLVSQIKASCDLGMRPQKTRERHEGIVYLDGRHRTRENQNSLYINDLLHSAVKERPISQPIA